VTLVRDTGRRRLERLPEGRLGLVKKHTP